MRTILFFDLPMTTNKEVRDYNKFLNFIKKQGFVMLQESVYTKLSLNQKIVNLTIASIKKNLPSDGIVSVITLTETQFNSMIHLLGDVKTDVVMSEDKVVEL